MYIKLHGYKTCPSGAYPCCSFRCIQNYIGIKLESCKKKMIYCQYYMDIKRTFNR